jgi:hypothetical protein
MLVFAAFVNNSCGLCEGCAARANNGDLNYILKAEDADGKK